MTLKLNNIDVECVIGERADERDRLQKLRVDVELTIPDTVGTTDELTDTVDYAALVTEIRAALVDAKCRMIERAAKLVADCLPPVPARVTVTKVGAIPHLESASVIYETTRT